MPLTSLFNLQKEEKNEIVKKLLQKSYPGSSFYIMIALASFLASLGLILNNLAVIIGSMLVAPLLYPVVFLGMSIVMHSFDIITRTLLIVGKIMILGILIGFFSAILFSPFSEINETGLFRDSSVLPIFYIAIGSGLAASFAITRKQMEEFLPGVAVSIALLPPLVNVGVNLGLGRFFPAIHSLQIFLISVFGIIFAGIVVFSLMGFVAEKQVAAETLKEEKSSLQKGSAELEERKK